MWPAFSFLHYWTEGVGFSSHNMLVSCKCSHWHSNCNHFQHDAKAVVCDNELSSQLQSAACAALKRITGESAFDVPVLISGAGHDAMAMSHLTKVCSYGPDYPWLLLLSFPAYIQVLLHVWQVGMLFVRCRGGISHSPAEHVMDDDVWAASMAILAFLETLL